MLDDCAFGSFWWRLVIVFWSFFDISPPLRHGWGQSENEGWFLCQGFLPWGVRYKCYDVSCYLTWPGAGTCVLHCWWLESGAHSGCEKWDYKVWSCRGSTLSVGRLILSMGEIDGKGVTWYSWACCTIHTSDDGGNVAADRKTAEPIAMEAKSTRVGKGRFT